MEMIIALGSNLGDRETVLMRALEEIEIRIGPVIACSKWHETEPLLHPEKPVSGQSDYLNGVAVITTDWTPEEALEILLDIEQLLGRIREEGKRWGPRLIDLDLIAAEDRVIQTTFLTLPHPEMHRRDFVLSPMLEVRPDWRHPILKMSVGELLNDLN